MAPTNECYLQTKPITQTFSGGSFYPVCSIAMFDDILECTVYDDTLCEDGRKGGRMSRLTRNSAEYIGLGRDIDSVNAVKCIFKK